jgi:hypothetical protein
LKRRELLMRRKLLSSLRRVKSRKEDGIPKQWPKGRLSLRLSLRLNLEV